jgi:hypothetical protein
MKMKISHVKILSYFLNKKSYMYMWLATVINLYSMYVLPNLKGKEIKRSTHTYNSGPYLTLL